MKKEAEEEEEAAEEEQAQDQKTIKKTDRHFDFSESITFNAAVAAVVGDKKMAVAGNESACRSDLEGREGMITINVSLTEMCQNFYQPH